MQITVVNLNKFVQLKQNLKYLYPELKKTYYNFETYIFGNPD